VTELGSVTKGRSGSTQHSRIFTDRARRGVPGWVRHKRPAGSLVPCTGETGTAVLWFPARAVRARPFSSSQHGRYEHSHSLVPNTRGAWPGGGVLRCCRREKRRRTEEKRSEILIGADQDQNLFFSVVTLSCFQTRSSVSGFLLLALLRKPNREAKGWRWWWC
jgi:hypothetical protein